MSHGTRGHGSNELVEECCRSSGGITLMELIDMFEARTSSWRKDPIDIGLEHPLEMELFVCRGRYPKPLIVVTGGVHGDEYEGPMAIARLSQLVRAEDLHGSLIAVPVANPMAFMNGSRTSPDDDGNLNRAFPGNRYGNATQRLAAWLFDKLARGADYLIDLHSGGVEYRFAPVAGFYDHPSPENSSFQAARHFGLPLLWQLPPTLGVLSCEAWKAGIVAIGLEYLGSGQLAAKGISGYVDGILSCLALWGLLPQKQALQVGATVLGGDWMLSSGDGLFLSYCELEDRVVPGQRLAEVVDLRGRTVQEFESRQSGVVLGLRSKGHIHKGDWGVLVGTPVEA
jgi:predicted deacylase